ncbi:MAG TPA: 50S ribosomal protein L10 [Gemmata sp.]|nr:50S ribosomal protein L10 [Gemmata sp.]
MSKKIKELELNTLRTTFKGVKDMVLLEPLKLDSATDFELRKRLREKQIRVKMVKNSLVKKVFDENGVAVETGGGPTLLVWGGKNVKDLSTTVDSLLKELKKDPKAPDRVKIKTAVAEGEAITIEEAKSRPTREEAVGAIVAAIMGPAQSIAACLTGPATSLAGILKAIEEKGPAAGGEAAPAPAAG